MGQPKQADSMLKVRDRKTGQQQPLFTSFMDKQCGRVKPLHLKSDRENRLQFYYGQNMQMKR